jgi:hypothetical protein
LCADEDSDDDCDDGGLLPLLSFSPSIIIVKEMIRDEVIFWGAAILLVVFAFVLMPSHERFKDAQGREVDVDPNAPPKPEWLKSTNPRTGKIEGFWEFFSPSREKMIDAPLSGITAQQSSTPPQFTTDSTLGSTTGTTGMEYTMTTGDLQEAQVRFIQTMISNEPDQATKLSLGNGLANLQAVVKGAPPSVTNIPLGSMEMAVYNALTNVPGTYTYSQFVLAYRKAGGVSSSPENIVFMVQNIPTRFKAVVAARPAVSNVSQVMSDMSAPIPPDLYGPGPNVLRSALKSCSCASSKSSGCPIHS